MKTIIFLRHGKAAEKGPHIDDRSRLLVDKGKIVTAENMIAMKEKIPRIDRIISSGAWRAKMTAEIAASVLEYDRNYILYDPKLRPDSHIEILEAIHELPDEWNTVILVGHNDTLSDAMNALTQNNLGSMPKSGIVSQTFICSSRDKVSKNTRQKQRK